VRPKKKQPLSPRNPWNAGTLEWLPQMPAEPWGVRSIPEIDRRYPLWEQPNFVRDVDQGRFYLPDAEEGRRETLVTSVIDAKPVQVLRLPGPSFIPLWAWHAPALHHFARRSASGFAAEQFTFITAGLLVWLAAFGGGAARIQERRGAGIAALLLTSMHMTLLGALLALSPRPLYVHAEVCALAPLDDQHLGGAIMLLVGGVSYLAGGAWLTRGLLRPAEHREGVA
jgi:hypothetical protein